MTQVYTQVLYRTQRETKLVETVLVKTRNGSAQMVTRVNGQSIYIPGLTSVVKYTTDREAQLHHARWAKTVLEAAGYELGAAS